MMKQITTLQRVRCLPGVIAAAALWGSALLTASVGVADDLETRLVGRQPDGSVVLPTNQVIKPAGTQVEFRGRPNVVALSPDGRTAAFLNGAYVSNQGGRPASEADYTNDSSGTPIVADPSSGRAVTGTVSVVDLALGAQVNAIEVGLQYVSGLRADGVEMGPWISWLGHGDTLAGTWSDFYNDALLLAGDPDADLDADLHVDLEAHSDIPSLQAIINTDYPPYHMVIPDQYRVEVFLREFAEYVENGDLPELNPDLASLDGIRKAWALASMEMDFSAPDTADPELLNRAIWYSAKGFDRPYPGDERVLAPDEVHASLKARGERGTAEAEG